MKKLRRIVLGILYVLTVGAFSVSGTACTPQVDPPAPPPATTYSVTNASTQAGGYIEWVSDGKRNKKITQGSSAEFTIYPPQNYVVESVILNGQDITSTVANNKFTVENVSADITLQVTYAMQQYTIAQEKIGNGTLSVSGNAYYGQEITVTATPETGYKVKKLLVNGINCTTLLVNGSYKFYIFANASVSVEFEKIEYTVTANTPANGTISVSQNTKFGDTVEVTVTPATGYKVASFTVDGVDKKAELQNNAYSFVINKNTAIAVEFEKIEYTVTANNPANGTISVSQNTKYGDTVFVSVVPATGYKVATFTVDGVDKKAQLQNNAYSFAISKDTAVQVTFEKIDYSITTVITNGTVNVVNSAKHNDQVTFTVTPDAGYIVKSVKVNGKEVNDYTFTITQNTVITCVIEKADFTITAQAENGEVNVVNGAKYGDEVAFEVSPNYGYAITSVKANGTTLVQKDGKYSFIIEEDTHIIAEFEKITYNITTQIENGQIEVVESAKYLDQISFVVKADYGYKVNSVKVNGIEVSEYTFTIDKDTTIEVETKKVDFTITTEIENGKIEVENKAEYQEEVSFTVTADYGYKVTSVKVNGIEVSEYKFTIEEDTLIVVTTAKVDFNITTQVENATIEVVDKAQYQSQVTFEVTADYGYEITSVKVNGIEVADYKFTIEKDTEIVVTTAKVDFAITTQVENATIEVVDKAQYQSQVSFEVTADYGYEITSVKVNGIEVEEYKFTITADTLIEVTTAKVDFAITTQGDNATIEVVESAEYQSEVMFTVSADYGYEITSVKVNGTEVEEYKFTITADTLIVVETAKVDFAITTQANNAKIEVVDKAQYESEVSFEVTADYGYEITKVKVNGQVVTDYKFTITENTEIVVETAKVDFAITKIVGENGTLSAPASSKYLDTVQVEVTPSTGYKVATFTVDGEEIELVDGKYSFVIEKDTEIAVEFEKIEYSVTTNNPENGTINVSENTKYGDVVVVEVTPSTGYKVASFTVDGEDKELVGGKYSFVIDKNVEIAVEFELITYTITTNAVENGSVEVVATAKHFDEVEVKVNVDYGYQVKSFKVNGSEVELEEGKYTFVITTNTLITVETAKVDFAITTQGDNATIEVVESATYLDEVTFEVTADYGYEITSVKVNGTEVSEYKFTITENTEIVVETEKVDFTITTQGDNATIEVVESATYLDEVTFTVEPAYGYKVTSVKVNGIEVEEYKFTITEDTLIEVTTAKVDFNITKQANNATIEVVDSAEYQSEVTFTVSADYGYEIVKVEVNGQVVTDYKFTITADTEIVVETEKVDFAITTQASNATINVVESAEYQSEVSFEVTADYGYEVTKVTVNGVEVSEYKFTITENTEIVVETAKVDFAITTQGDNATINVVDSAEYQSEVTFTVEPAYGYEIVKVEVNGVEVSDYKFTITADTEIVVETAKVDFNITTQGDNATIEVVDKAQYQSEVTFTVVADYGYEITSVKVNGIEVEEYKFTITEDTTIAVETAKVDFNITTQAENATINVVESAEYQSQVSFEVTADYGYEITSVKVNGEIVTDYKFTIEKDTLIEVTAEKKKYSVKYTDINGAEIEVETVEHGDNIKGFKYEPRLEEINNGKFTFINWLLNGQEVGAITEDCTLSPNYSIKYSITTIVKGEYTVEYYDVDNFNNGALVSTPADVVGLPVQEKFDGWFFDKECTETNAFVEGSYSKNITLYAKIVENEWATNVIIKKENVENNEYAQDSDKVPYTFVGYIDNETEFNKEYEGFTFEKIEADTENPSIVTAYYNRNTYTVTVKDIDETVLGIIENVKYQATVDLSSFEPTFGGDTSKEHKGTWKYNDGTLVGQITGNVDVYPVFEQHYTITTIVKGIASETIDYIEGAVVNVPNDATGLPVQEMFAGWYLDEECTQEFVAGIYNANITLYAKVVDGTWKIMVNVKKENLSGTYDDSKEEFTFVGYVTEENPQFNVKYTGFTLQSVVADENNPSEITATYSRNSYAITTQIENATINVAENAKYQSEVAFTVEPAYGYKVTGVKVNGQVVTDYKFTIEEDTEIVVETAKVDFAITTQVTNATTEVVDKAQYQSEVTFTAVADYGYEIVSVKVNGQVVTDYKFTIEEDTTIVVETAKVDFAISTQAENATINVVSSAEYQSEVTFEVTPAYGYEITSVKVNGQVVDEYKFTITQNTEIVVETAKVDFAITTQVENATINVVSSAEYQSEVTFEVTPDYGYEIVSVKVNGQVVDEYKFTISKNTEIVVETAKVDFAITTQIENATIEVVESATYLDEVTFTVVADYGYEITSVKVNGNEVTDYKFTIEEDTTIVVETAKVDFAITTQVENATIEVVNKAQYQSEVTFTVTPDYGYEIVSVKVNGQVVNGKWTATNGKEKIIYAFTIIQDTIITVETEIRTYAILASSPGNGSATTPYTSAKHGEEVTVTITPDVGYQVDRLIVNGEFKESELVDNKYIFTITSDTTIRVTFERITYTVSKNNPENGTISVSQDTKYGDTVVVTVTPAEGYQVKNFTVDGADKKSDLVDGKYSFVINKNVEVAVEFEKQTYTIETQVSNATINVVNSALYETEVTFTVVADYGYEIVSVKVNGVEVDEYKFTITQNTEIVVETAKVDFTITTQVENATIEVVESATYLDEVTFTVVADYGYEIVSVQVNGVEVSEYKFIIEEDTTIVVETAKVDFDITTQAENATIEVVDKAEYQSEVTFTVEPAYGYEIVKVLVNGVEVDEYTFTIEEDTTIVVETAKVEFAITTQVSNATIEVVKTATYLDEVTFEVTADYGYEIVSVKVNGQVVTDYKFKITQNTEIVVEIAKVDFTITTQVENATIEVADKAQYQSEVTFEVAPAYGYEIVSVKVNGQVVTDYKFKITQNTEIVVETAKVDFAITTQVSNATIEVVDKAQYQSEVTFTVEPAYGYEIVSVKVNGEVVTDYKFTIEEDTLIVVETAKVDFDITTQVENAIIEVVDKAQYQSEVTFTVVADYGYEITSVKVNGQVVTDYKFTITADTTIVVETAKVDFAITTQAENATIEVVDKAQYQSEVTFTVEPVYGYEITSVKVNGVAVDEYKFTITQNTEIVVETAKVDFAITGQVENATINVANKATYLDEVTFTVVADYGYEITSVKVNGQVVTDYKFTITQNTEIVVETAKVDFAITGQVENATINVANKATYLDEVTFTVVADYGYEITSVKVNGQVVTDYKFTITQNTEIVVETAKVDFAITTQVSNATIEVVDKAQYQSEVTFEVTPDYGYEIVSVKVNGEEVDEYIFTIEEDTTIVVETAKVDFAINTQAENATIEVADKAQYQSEVTFTVTPAYGYEIVSVKVNGVAVDEYKFTITANTQIVVETAKVDFAISTEVENATINVANKATYLDEVTFTVTPAYGYEIVSVKVNGQVVTDYKFTIEEDTTIVVETAKVDFAITTQVSNATIKVVDKAQYQSEVTFTVEAAYGYEIVSVKVNGVEVDEYKFTIEEDTEIVVETAKKEYSISTNSPENGTISVSETAQHGDTVVVTVTPAEGYKVATFTVDGVEVELVDNKYSFVIEKDTTIAVEFEQDGYSVTINKGESIANGTVDVVYKEKGAVITLNPNDNYTPVTFTVDTDDKWSSLVDEGNGKYTYIIENLESNVAIECAYAYTHTIYQNGATGTPSYTVNLVKRQKLIIKTDPGYSISRVTLGGTTQSTLTQVDDTTYTLTASKNGTALKVTYAAAKYNVTANTPDHGTISIGGLTLGKASYNSEITIYTYPDDGYKVKNLKVNGTDIKDRLDESGICTYTVTGTTTIEIEFIEEGADIPVEPVYYTITDDTADKKGTLTWTVNGEVVGAQVEQGSDVVFTINVNDGYKVTYLTVNGSAVVPENNTFVVQNVQSNISVIIYYEAKKLNVTYDKNPTNGQISVGGLMSGQVDYGKGITITLRPNANYEIKSLTINGVDVTAQVEGDTYTVKVYEDIVIACEFALVKYNVTVVASENGTIEVSGVVDSKAEYDSQITITVTPNENFKIETFTINGNAKTLNANNQYTLTITEDVVIECTYLSSIEYSVIDETQTHYGTIYWNVGTKYNSTIPAGETVQFTLTPNGGYGIEKVLVNGEEVQLTLNTFSVENVQSNITIKVIYTLPKYTITYNNNPLYGTFAVDGVGEDGTVEHGQTITVTAIPDEGYRIKTLTIDGFEYKGSLVDSKYTKSVIANTEIYCEFELIEFAVITETVANGTLSVSGVGESGKVLPNTQITINVTVNAGYKLDKLTINGKDQVIDGNIYTLVVNEDITISAQISLVTYSVISVCSSEFGSVYIDNANPSYFDTVKITFTPLNDNCALMSAIVNGKAVTVSNNVLELSGITADTVIDAVFDYTKTTFTGSVEYEDGIKATGVRVSVGSSYANTNASGVYSIVLPKGTHTFSVNEYGWTARAKGSESLTVTTLSYTQQGPTIVLVNNNPVNPNDPVMANVELENVENTTLYYNVADAYVGNEVTFTITPANNRAIEKVKVNGTSYTPVYTVEKDYEVTCTINSENIVVEPIYYAVGAEPTQVSFNNGSLGEHNYDASLFYRNDGDVNGADPGVIYVSKEEDATYGGYFYMATSSNYFNIYRSKDLTTWEYMRTALTSSGAGWTEGDYWAPEIFRETVNKTSGGTKSRYVLYFNARSKVGNSTTEYTSNTIAGENRYYIGSAVSDCPYGPYTLVDTSTFYSWYSGTEKASLASRSTNQNGHTITANTPSFNFYKYVPGIATEYSNSTSNVTHTIDYWPAIDASPYVDPETGKMYMYFSQHGSTYTYKRYGIQTKTESLHKGNTIWVMEMADPITPLYETMHIVAIPGYSVKTANYVDYLNAGSNSTHAESYSGDTDNGQVNEGAFVIDYVDPTTGQRLYYLTYSPNGMQRKDYSVLQAVSTSPNGPFKKINKKQGGLVVGVMNADSGSAEEINYTSSELSDRNDYMTETGHHSLVRVGNEVFSIHHSTVNPVSNYDHYNDSVDGFQGRRISVTKVDFAPSQNFTYSSGLYNGSGSTALPLLYGNGPTRSLQPQPALASGYDNVASLATVTASGTGSQYLTDDLHVSQSAYKDWEYKVSGGETITFDYSSNPQKVRSVMVYNSAYYEYALKTVRSITLTLTNGQTITYSNVTQDSLNYNSTKSVMRYGGSIIASFNEVEVSKIQITVNSADKLNTSSSEIRIGDIKILARVDGSAKSNFEFRSNGENATSDILIDGIATDKEWASQKYYYFDNGNFNGKLTAKMGSQGVSVTATVYDKHIYHSHNSGVKDAGAELSGEGFWYKNTFLRLFANAGGSTVRARFSAYDVDTSKSGDERDHYNINGNVSVVGEVNSGNTKSFTFEAYIPYSTLGVSNPSQVKLLLEYARPMDADSTTENSKGSSGTDAILTPKIFISQSGINKITSNSTLSEYFVFDKDGYVSSNSTIGAGAQGGAVVGGWTINSDSATATSTTESLVYFAKAYSNKFVASANVSLSGGHAGFVVKKGNNKRAFLLDTSSSTAVIYSYENGIKEEIYRYSGVSISSAPTFKLIKNNEKIYLFINNKFVYAEANNKYAGNSEVGLYSKGATTSFTNASYSDNMSSVIEGLKTAYNISAVVPSTLNTIVGYKNTDKLYVFVSAVANTAGAIPSAVKINGVDAGATFSIPTGKQSLYYETAYTAGKAACVEVSASTLSTTRRTYSGTLRKASGFYPAISQTSQITFYADAVTLRFVSSSYVYEVVADKTFSVSLPQSTTYTVYAISADGGLNEFSLSMSTSNQTGKTITLNKQ